MNTTIKKLSILLLAGMALFSVNSCGDKDKDKYVEPPKPKVFAITGTVSTEKTINANNTIQAVTDIEDETFDIVGTSSIKNKKFSIPLGIPKVLMPINLDGFPETISIDNPKAKIAICSMLQLLNGGTMPPSDEMPMDMLMCSNEKPQIDFEGGYSEPENTIVYMYVDSNLKIKGSFKDEAGDEVEYQVIMNLDLKKGWNIVKMVTKPEKSEAISLTTVPSDYKWYLMSDFVFSAMPLRASTPRFNSSVLSWLK